MYKILAVESISDCDDIYHGRSDDNDAQYLISYVRDVLTPASCEFLELLGTKNISLHQAFSFNAILAHAIDYMVFIARKHVDITRGKMLSDFDDRYSVEGSIHINNKFKLLDAVNNSFKHVELDSKRYEDLEKVYGSLNFQSLKENNGKIFFVSPGFKFDYCRVVMRPIAKIFDCELNSTEDIDDFINGRVHGCFAYGSFEYDYEPHDAIDRMIDACNPRCIDCGEYGGDCDCPNFIYANESGDFSPEVDAKFDFSDAMSEISGSREWRK